MSWVLMQKRYENQTKPIRICGKNFCFTREFVNNNKYVSVFFDEEKKLIGFRFGNNKESHARKFYFPNKNKAYVSAFSLLNKLAIPLETKADFDCEKKGDMFVISYKDLV